jgi:predicted 2-oxoglutarate/Fe(II)-dependent dioxygenase YbiX
VDLKDLIYIKQVLTEDQCDALIAEREERDNESRNEACLHAFNGQMTTSTFKQVELIPDTTNFSIVHEATSNLLKDWIDSLESLQKFHTPAMRHQFKYSHKYRLMKYDLGQWIHPHTDYNLGTVGSLTIALNDESEYDGGDFVFFNEYRVRLKKGEGMVFPANHFYVHEVEPIFSGLRYSVNSFIRQISEKTFDSFMEQLENSPDDMIYTPWRHKDL